MKIFIKRIGDAVHMEATNKDGAVLSMDGSPAVGGVNAGMRPMQALLSSLGGCSGIDVIDILKKQKQDLQNFSIEINGQREDKPAPSVFTDIHVHFTLSGNLDESKVKRAVDLSMTRYCSVARILEKTAKISYSFTIENKQD